MEDSFITVKNLTFNREKSCSIQQLNFQLERGEAMAFVGPNGAGKSTALKLIAGNLQPHQGQVLLCGHNIHQHSSFCQRRIGYLPEKLPLYPSLTTREMLEFVARLRRIDRQNRKLCVDLALESLGLEPNANQLISALSQGTQQRLAIAQTLLHNPDLLLLDEPSNSLDPGRVKQLLELLQKYKHNQTTLIIASHHLDEVAALCNQVAYFQEGKIIKIETVQQAKNELSKRYFELTETILQRSTALSIRTKNDRTYL